MGETRGCGQRGKLGSGKEGTEQIMESLQVIVKPLRKKGVTCIRLV